MVHLLLARTRKCVGKDFAKGHVYRDETQFSFR